MYVVATAGHVDHGKSTLVRALTGMEPDRWAVERRRGMTIDLGFVWTTLPSGAELAIVDVPGHRRFIGNMLSGIGPVPGVLFVVAADEGWREQSAEHLRAVQALGVRHGVLAITRCDRADPGPALLTARAEMQRAGLEPVPAVAVCAVTGYGLADLVTALDAMTLRMTPPDPVQRVRLWIDRSFTIQGSGTVVTGTLSCGAVGTGDSLNVCGVGALESVSVRAVEALGVARDRVSAPARIALNLRRVAPGRLRRGDTLLTPQAWHLADVVDVRSHAFEERLPLRLTLHVGTAAVRVRARPLAPGALRLTLERALPLQPGDRAILRDPGGRGVIAGVVILDADPPQLRRRGAAALRAAQLADSPERPDLASALRGRGSLAVEAAQRLGVPRGQPLPEGVLCIGSWYVEEATWRAWTAGLSAAVTAHRRAHPLQPGMPTAAAVARLDLPDPALLEALVTEAGLMSSDGRVSEPAAAPDLGPAEAALSAFEETLARHPFAAPERGELQAAGLTARHLAAAASAGRIIALADDVVLLPTAPALAMRTLSALPQPFTASQARRALGPTRRVTIPLLEHLDRRGWTRRVDSGLREVAD